MEKLMALQKYVRQLRPIQENKIFNVLQFTEAYNVPIKSDEDIDSFDTKLDKSQLKLLLKYLQSLKTDDDLADFEKLLSYINSLLDEVGLK